MFRILNLKTALLLLLYYALFAPSMLRAQSDEQPLTNWRIRRAQVESEWVDDLKQLGTWCEENGLQAQMRQTYQWYLHRDPGRTYIFLPGEEGFAPVADGIEGQWEAKLNDLRRQHASRILELAEQAAAEDAGTDAFRFLNEVLRYDPDNAAVREMLGHRRSEDGWRVASDRIRSRQETRKKQVLMDWAAGTWVSVNSPHFNISSQAGEEATIELARKLERWHGVWRQVFFEFWSRPANVRRWIEGESSAPRPSRKFDVIFFASEQDYVNQLSQFVQGVEGSTGYYNDSTKCSFFFASDDPSTEDTWRHELTHQLFQESIRTRSDPFENGHLWLGEGIAMYFESMLDFGDFVTLGGFDSRRVQYARIRRFREGYAVPLAEIAFAGREQFQRRDDLRRLYSQSAGFAHMLMDHNSGEFQHQLAAFIKMMYQGRLRDDAFEKAIGLSFEQLEEQYSEYLAVDSEQVQNYLLAPSLRTELALPQAGLTAEAFERIAACENLTWLDLTANDVRGSQLAAIGSLQNLEDIYMTACRVDRQTIEAISSLPGLIELDLSGSSVTDAELPLIATINSLKIVRLGRTAVTQDGLDQLKQQRPDLTIE